MFDEHSALGLGELCNYPHKFKKKKKTCKSTISLFTTTPKFSNANSCTNPILHCLRSKNPYK